MNNTLDQTELSRKVMDHGKIHTPWSGKITMSDGIAYFGNVYSLNRRFYVFYQNNVVNVVWRDGAYHVA